MSFLQSSQFIIKQYRNRTIRTVRYHHHHHHYHHPRRTVTTNASTQPSIATTTTTTTTRQALPIPRVISRRAWDAYQKKKKKKEEQLFLKNNKNSNNNNNNNNKETKKDDKPWSKSFIYTGYVVGGTLVPYFMIWFLLSNDTTRPYVLPYINNSQQVELILRHHFGQPEYDQIPYVDQQEQQQQQQQQMNTNSSSTMPHSFLGEENVYIREQQKRIAIENERNIWVRMTTYRRNNNNNNNNNDNDDNDNESMTLLSDETKLLPAKTRANPTTLCPQDMMMNTVVGVEFPEEEEDDDDDAENVNNHNSLHNEMNNNNDISMTFIQKKEKEEKEKNQTLRSRVSVYSLWHYLPVAPQASSSTSSSTTTKMRNQISELDMKKALLQDDIFELEQELRSGMSPRSVDDIMFDLEQKKRQIRRLQWMKYLPWS